MKTKGQNAKPSSNVSVPIELWEKISKIVKHGRVVRCNPENWPLEPFQMAGEIRRLHFWLREIDESEEFVRVSMTDAFGKLAAHRKQNP